MDKIALVKSRVQETEWATRIRQCSESGLTVASWCRENGINSKTYYYHLRKLRKQICEQIPVPVMTVPERVACVKISIGDITAEISEDISENIMTSVIRAMRNA